MVNGIFKRYGEITKKMMLCLKEDKDVDELMQERENILKELDNSKYSRAEKLECYKNLELDGLDKSFEETIKNQMISIKNEIKDTQNRNTAFSGYASSQEQRNLFTKKV